MLVALWLRDGYLTNQSFGKLNVSMRRDTVVNSILSALMTMLDKHAALDNNGLVQLNSAWQIIDSVIELKGEEVLANL